MVFLSLGLVLFICFCVPLVRLLESTSASLRLSREILACLAVRSAILRFHLFAHSSISVSQWLTALTTVPLPKLCALAIGMLLEYFIFFALFGPFAFAGHSARIHGAHIMVLSPQCQRASIKLVLWLLFCLITLAGFLRAPLAALRISERTQNTEVSAKKFMIPDAFALDFASLALKIVGVAMLRMITSRLNLITTMAVTHTKSLKVIRRAVNFTLILIVSIMGTESGELNVSVFAYLHKSDDFTMPS